MWVKAPTDIGAEGIIEFKVKHSQSYWVRVRERVVRRNRKHLFVLPVPCDFSKIATDNILPMALQNSQGNIIIESNANLCSSNNLPIANNSPACAADFPTLANSGINNANASASVS